MRYFTGALPGGPQIWPTPDFKGSPAPGPTIRAKVGDTVEITLLNQVDVAAFGDSLDTGETTGACDVATSAGPAGSVNTYPGNPAFDTMPNCFHGSSTANMHYHGSHVTPTVIGDNVFVQLRPSPREGGKPVVDEAYLKKNDFNDIFTNCETGHSPQTWSDLPKDWQNRQQDLLTRYDKTAVWQGKRGALPLDQQLWPKNAADIKAGRWPQFYVGAYPSCLQIPAWNGRPDSMGQAPGTHWYHAHKHGSTALNLSNGLSGAFIIEGDYDKQLQPFFNKEVVLVLQQLGAQVNLERAVGTGIAPLVYVNGQYTPVITMQPNEVQLWRIINTCHSRNVPIIGPPGVRWIQTAQDGVQLDPRNYALGLKTAQPTPGGPLTNATLTSPMVLPPWFGNLAPGNRVDMLVQAPSSGGTFQVMFTQGGGTRLLFTINVTNTPIGDKKTFPPPQDSFPTMPPFLKDLSSGKVSVRRTLRFKTEPAAASRGASPNPPAGTNPPVHTIDGKLFQDHMVDQTMHLGAIEEWTIYNDNGTGGPGPAHPFHIHVNPFQVIEISSPAIKPPLPTPTPLPDPWVWWDNIAIPPGGYVKFLTRFADYTGMYVLHCHILGHEDRGMMQMVQVVSNMTSMGHR